MTTPDIFRSLSPEELAKVKPITEEEIIAALEQGARDREAMEPFIYSHPGYFR